MDYTHDEQESLHHPLKEDSIEELDLESQPGYGVSCGRHRKMCSGRWCGVCVGVTLALILTTMLLTIFLGGSAFAQKSLDNAGIRVSTMSMSDFNSRGFQLHLVAIMDNRSPVAANTHDATVSMKFNGEVVGSTTLPAQKLPAGGELELDLQQSVTVDPAQQAAFTKLSSALLNQEEVQLTMHAKVDVHALGLTLKGLTLDKQVSLNGFNGFKSPAPLVTRSAVVSTTKNTITMELDISLDNTASVAIGDLGPLSLSLHSGETHLGNATTNTSAALAFGVNTYTARALLVRPTNPKDQAVFTRILSNYSSGLPSTVQMQGLATDKTPTLLVNGLEQLQTQGVLPGLSRTLR
eukprot:TRINITY_DN6662_c0_g1_i5.p1 TRINITY_DN6662_c0_g1~~TRINITY_DN6662_c0_g1_i5.p1  ORF type:complete len:351 (-),score=80.28 TRINITY_DN6662_c0_g1_i5:3-1055(-)